MPSPGVATIKAALVGTTFTVDQTIGDTTESLTCSFTEDAPVVNKLAAGIDSGWTSASPTTISTMAAAISTEFAYLGSAPGVVYLVAIGTAIDTETTAWAASWNAQAATHAYAPQKAAAMATYKAAVPAISAGMEALAEAAIDAFLADFGQEAG